MPDNEDFHEISWADAAQKLAQWIPLDSIPPLVLKQLQTNNSHWTIAVSGGVDSLAVVLFIYGHFGSENKTILTYNHKLRPEADSEVLFVQALASELGFGFATASRLDNEVDCSEADLRNLRRAFFKEQMAQLNSSLLITGHQLDDVAETLLMRITRGSGTAGLAAPRPVQSMGENTFVVRPLLSYRKKELLSFLNSLHLPWCEDSSNAQNCYFRNAIRNQVVPTLASLTPTDFWKGVDRTRSLLEEDDDALSQWVDEVLGDNYKGDWLDLNPLKGKPLAFLRRVLHKWLLHNNLNKNLSSKAFDKILFTIFENKAGKFSIGCYNTLVTENIIAISKEPTFFKWAPLLLGPEETVSTDYWELSLNKVDLTDEKWNSITSGNVNDSLEAYVHLKCEDDFKLKVRMRESGDSFTRIGTANAKKLKKWHLRCQFGEEQKETIPVITTSKNEIIWVPGLPINHNFRLVNKKSDVFKLTFIPRFITKN